jgi:hypothetical protein
VVRNLGEEQRHDQDANRPWQTTPPKRDIWESEMAMERLVSLWYLPTIHLVWVLMVWEHDFNM